MSATVLSPALPFTLGMHAPPAASAVDVHLAQLRELMRDTRDQVEILRRDSAVIIGLLRPAAGAAPIPRPSGRAEPEAEAAAVKTTQVRFYLMGSFEVYWGGRPILARSSRKSRLLLAYLAMHAGKPIPRDALIDLFWPDSSPARGSNNLSIAVYQIRAMLKDAIASEQHGVTVQQGLYGLDRDATCWIDVEEMQRCLSQARTALQQGDRRAAKDHMVAAIELYRGEFLASEPYEDWTAEPRRSLGAAYARGLAWLAEDAAESRDWHAVIDFAKRSVERDACDEEAHRWLMTGYWKLGNRARALQQYQRCEERLRSELGVPPSEATRRLYTAMRS